jgi:uncharacterized protein (DUF1330 family)
MAAYCLFDLRRVKNAANMEVYQEHVLATVDHYGGRFLVVGGKCDVKEGNVRPVYPVMIEFPNLNQARRWYDSEEYRHLKALLLEAVDANAFIMQGL